MSRDLWSDFGMWPTSLGLAIAIIVYLATAIVGRWPARTSQSTLKTPKPSKSLTFRADDIPIDHVDDLDRNLQSLVELDTDLRSGAVFFVRHSLAHKDRTSMCATVSTITFFSGKELCTRLFRLGKTYPYSYSCDFDGITPLFEDSNGAAVDIIAVPGLGSHALGSWKSPHSDDVWLRDFLPQNVPGVRVLLYGYDTTLPGSLSKQSIEDLGGILVERVVAFRANDGTTCRPVIFIGHSLGGLLIKEALIRARKRRGDAIADLAKACYALLFFGVPNLGLRNDQLRTLVRGQPNKALIDSLCVDNDSEPSPFLKRLADQFSESCKDQYRVMSFYERVLSRTLERDEEGEWRKTGPPSLLVTEKSATGTGLVAVADEDNIPLNTDHSGLVKYSNKGQGDYTIVRRRIAECVEKAKADVPRRFAEHSFEQAHSKTTQACMRSLAFEEIDGRHNGIDTAAAGTCEWLLKHEIFAQWTHEPRGLLWIKGKPGSGKSTLMKYALEKVPPLYGTQPLVLSFFFHGRGHELQRSLLGLFRSLLHQMLDVVPGALPDLLSMFDHNCKTIGEAGKKWQWHLPLLQTFFQSSLSKILKRRAILVFIDALDECGEEPAVQLIEYLKHLLAGLPPGDLGLNVCFSCRHYPIIELDGGSTILLDAENNEDIDMYVRARLPSDQDSHYRSLLSSRAQGVFMWAHIVVDRVLQMKRRREPAGRIRSKVERIPMRLDDLYNELLQSVEDRADTIRLVQWICFSTRPLTTDEMAWAMAIDPRRPNQTLTDCQQSDEFISQDNIDERVISLSCGLAEVTTSPSSRVVQFIHQSVKDYFIEHGLLVLDGRLGGDLSLASTVEHHLCLQCISYFRMTAFSQAGHFRKDDIERFPFLKYVTTSMVSHMKGSEPVERSARDILEGFDWPSSFLVEQWVVAYEAFEQWSWDRPSNGSSLVHIASRYGLEQVLSQILSDSGNEEIDSKDSNNRTPLSWAAENGRDTVVKMLLETGKVDVDSKNSSGRTPLSYAASSGNEAVVKMLLETCKVDVDSKDTKYGQTPLSWAAENGRDTVVKMLVETGKVDIDSKDNSGRTLLSYAATSGNEAVVKMLLETGKVDIDSKDSSGRTLLSYAATSGNEAVVKMLLETGRVDIDSKDNSGRTPLSYAAEDGHDTVVKMLVETGKVDVDSKDTKYGQTPLSWAAENGHEAVIIMLLGTGQTSIDSRDNTGRTSLLLAAGKRNEAVVNILLDTGKADINSSDSAGRTPLYWAADKGHVNVVSSLVDSRNADINVRDQDGFSPFMRAVWRSNKEVVRILLQTGLLSNHSCMDGLFYQAFWFMLADELDQFMVDIGYAVGDDFFGLRGLFGEL